MIRASVARLTALSVMSMGCYWTVSLHAPNSIMILAVITSVIYLWTEQSTYTSAVVV